MIKFKCLIYKETGTVIKYEDWKEAAKEDGYITIIKNSKLFINPQNIMKAKEMLFSEDFEIIYDSELSNLELISLYGMCPTRKTRLKLKRVIEQNHHLRNKYEIEI